MSEVNVRRCIVVGCNDTSQVKDLLCMLSIENTQLVQQSEMQYRIKKDMFIEEQDLFDMIYGPLLDSMYYVRKQKEKSLSEKTFTQHLNFGICSELEDLARLVWLEADTLVYINMNRYLKLFSRERQLFYRMHDMDFLEIQKKYGVIDNDGKKYSIVICKIVSLIPQYMQFSLWLNSRIKKPIEIMLIDEER